MNYLLHFVLLTSIVVNVTAPPTNTTESLLRKIAKELNKAIIRKTDPTLNIRLLTAAPQAALLVNSLSLVAASTKDISLENDQTKGAIRLLTTPKSFRASLYQTSQSISDSFRVARTSMLAVQESLDDVPDHMSSMIEAFLKPEDKDAGFLFQFNLNEFGKTIKMCAEQSVKAEQSFDNTLKIIRELIQVSTTTYGDREANVVKTNAYLNKLNIEKNDRNYRKQSLLVEIAKQHETVQDSLKKQNVPLLPIIDFSNSVFEKLVLKVGSLFGGGEDMSAQQREYLKVLEQEDAANRQAIAEIAEKIGNAEQDQLDAKDIIFYLAQGVQILNKIQENWGNLQDFFNWMQTIIVNSIFKDVEKLSKLNDGAKEKKSPLVVKQLTMAAFKSAVVCVRVARAASIYHQVSQKFVTPLIDGTIILQTMSKEHTQAALRNLERKMKSVTNETNQFIDEKLVEEQRKTQDQLTELFEDIKKAIKSS